MYQPEKLLNNPPIEDVHSQLEYLQQPPVDTKHLKPGDVLEVPWNEPGTHDFRVKTPTGRILAVQTSGDPNGHPVILLHGMPSGRVGVTPSHEDLYTLGVHLVTYDRPGYGKSDRDPERMVVDAAHDIYTIMNTFELQRPTAIGRSGGALHVLGCAALYSDQFKRVFALAPPAPMIAPEDIRYSTDLGSTNTAGMTRADTWTEQALTLHNEARAQEVVKKNPFTVINELTPDLQADDREFMSSYQRLVRLAVSHVLALTNQKGEPSAGGWTDDLCALWRKPLGFDLENIDGSKVTIWAGGQDPFCPSLQAKWIASQIPNATYVEDPKGSHFFPMNLEVFLDEYGVGRHASNSASLE